jgi:hypothetical protein
VFLRVLRASVVKRHFHAFATSGKGKGVDARG